MKTVKDILSRRTVATEADVSYSCTQVIDHSNEEEPETISKLEIPEGTELPHDVNSVTQDLDPRLDLDGEELIEPALDTIDVYTNVSEVIEGSLQNGGLSMEAAQLLNTFNHLNGVKARARVSTESFGTSGIYESRVALEGIKEFIAEWWRRFKEWLVQAKKKLSEWSTEILVKITNLKEKGQNLIEKANTASPGSGEVKVAKSNLLMIDGSMGNVVEGMRTLGSFADAQYVKVVSAGFDTANTLSNALQGVAINSDEDVGSLVQKLASGVKMPWGPYTEVLTNPVDNDNITKLILKGNESLQAKTFSSPKLLGNASIVGAEFALTPTGSNVETLRNFSEALKHSKVELVFSDQEGASNWTPSSGNSGSYDRGLPRLSPNDVRSVGESLVKLGTALEKTKDVMSQKNAADNALTQAGESVDGMTISDEFPEGKSVASSLRTMIASTASLIQSPVMKVTMYLIYVGQAAADYASKSIGPDHVESQNANESEVVIPEELNEYLSTQVSLESTSERIKEMAVKAYEWIKEQLVHFMKFTEVTFDAIVERVSYTGQLKAKSSALKDKIRNKSLAIKKDKVTFSNLYHLVNKKGRVDNITGLFSKGVDTLDTLVTFYKSRIPALSDHVSETFIRALPAIDNTVIESVNKSVTTLFTSNLGARFNEENDIYLSEELPGNKRVGFELIRAAEDNRILKVSWVVKSDDQEGPEPFKVAPLTFTEITSAFSSVDTIVTELEEMKSVAQTLKSQLTKTKSSLQSFEKELKGDKAEVAMKSVKIFNEFLNLLKGLSLKGIANIIGYYTVTANAMLAYIDASTETA